MSKRLKSRKRGRAKVKVNVEETEKEDLALRPASEKPENGFATENEFSSAAAPQLCLLPPDDPRVAESAWAHPPNLGSQPPVVPNNLFITVNGKVVMPVFSLPLLRAIAPRPPPRVEESSDSEEVVVFSDEEEPQEEKPVEKVKPQKRPATRQAQAATKKAKTTEMASKKSESVTSSSVALPLPTQENSKASSLISDGKPICPECGRVFRYPSMLVNHKLAAH